MKLWPTSRKARRRLQLVAVAAPVLAAAVGLSLYALQDTVSYFYSPSQAVEAKVPAGRTVRLGGLVETGSVQKFDDGRVEFSVGDGAAVSRVSFEGDLPDLFREGQGIVALGAFDNRGRFEARQVLAKHDETYMPREVADALKTSGQWRETSAP
jgi:cytochrome c-type biogenesis protein CcmE